MQTVSDTSIHEKRFAQWFCVLFVILGSVVFVFKRTDIFPWIGQCNPAGYSEEYYLAYCHSTRFGDYEHYALYNASEPQAVAALKQADVLFLGNSNTQYAFSTEAVEDYFNNSNTTHYVMGFGQGAQSPIAEAIIQKHQLQPKMLVANIDPFFSTETNGTFTRVLADNDELHAEFARKRKLQLWQSEVCADTQSRWFRWVCSGRGETLFRSRLNGHWLTDYYRENQQHPVTVSMDFLDRLDASATAANAFIASVGANRDCVVLTVTPRTGTPEAFAKALADKLDLPLIMPVVENLVTIDHSHLDKNSALRWSQAFLTEFDAHAQGCKSSIAHASAESDHD